MRASAFAPSPKFQATLGAREDRPPLSALGVAGSRPPCGLPGLPVAGIWGEGSPRCHAAPVHVRPCGLRPRGQPPVGGTLPVPPPPPPQRPRQAGATPPPLPPSPAGRQPPPHALSPNSPLPHLTWPRGARFSTAQVPWPFRADLAPGPRPGVAARRPLPRGGLAARRPPPCVAPTSPGRPQPSPRAPTGARSRASPHLAPLADRTLCGGRRRSPLPPPRPSSSSISAPKPQPRFRARAPCPLSPRANALTRPGPPAASPTAASEPAAAAAAASTAAAAAAHGS